MKIKKDLFNIVSRIKKIDNGYFIIFNKLKNRYEVHNKKQKGNTLAFCCDDLTLDKNVLIKAHKTSVRNSKKLIKDMIRNNEELDKKNEELIKEKHLERFNSLLYYADKKGCDIDFENIDKTSWV